jgi:hypothetical protein
MEASDRGRKAARVTTVTLSRPIAARGSRVRHTAVGGPDIWGRRALVITAGVWIAGVVIGFESALALLTAFGFAAAVWGMRQPHLGLIGISLLCTLDAITRHLLMTGGLLRWNTMNYWLVAVALFYARFVHRANDQQSLFAKLFIGFLALQLLASPDVNLGIQHLLGIVPMFGLLVYFVRATDDDRIWFWIAFVNGVAGALGGLLFNLQRSSLPALNHNAWGFFPLTAIFAISLSVPFFSDQKIWAFVAGLLAAVNLCWIFLSGSRGDLFIGTACILFVASALRTATARFAFVALTVVVGAFVLSSFGDLRERAIFRLEKLMDPEEAAESRTSGRTDLLKGGWHIFAEHPLGIGTGGFAKTWAGLGYIEGVSGFKYGEEMAAHAGWMKVLAENGLVGVALLAAFIGSFSVAAWKRRHRPTMRVGFLVTIVLSIAFTSTEFQPRGLWLLAAAGIAILNREYLTGMLCADRPAPRRRLVTRAREARTPA